MTKEQWEEVAKPKYYGDIRYKLVEGAPQPPGTSPLAPAAPAHPAAPNPAQLEEYRQRGAIPRTRRREPASIQRRILGGRKP